LRKKRAGGVHKEEIQDKAAPRSGLGESTTTLMCPETAVVAARKGGKKLFTDGEAAYEAPEKASAQLDAGYSG